MSIRSVTISLFLSMIFSTAAYSSISTSTKLHNEQVLADEWSKVCQRDISCKWEGSRCTYKSNAVMKFHCEKTTYAAANFTANLRLLTDRPKCSNTRGVCY